MILGSEFTDDMFLVSREKQKLTRWEKRVARQQAATDQQGKTSNPELAIDHPLDIPTEKLKMFQ